MSLVKLDKTSILLSLLTLQRVSTVKRRDRCCRRHKNSAHCCHRVVTQRLHQKLCDGSPLLAFQSLLPSNRIKSFPISTFQLWKRFPPNKQYHYWLFSAHGAQVNANLSKMYPQATQPAEENSRKTGMSDAQLYWIRSLSLSTTNIITQSR